MIFVLLKPWNAGAERLVLSTSRVAIGDTYFANASGFSPGENVQFSWTGPTNGMMGVFTADSSGAVRIKSGSVTLRETTPLSPQVSHQDALPPQSWKSSNRVTEALWQRPQVPNLDHSRGVTGVAFGCRSLIFEVRADVVVKGRFRPLIRLSHRVSAGFHGPVLVFRVEDRVFAVGP
jgi:hypothetical protein